MNRSEAAPWAIVSLKGQSFAISALDVQEMLIVPTVARIPQTPDYVRGVLNLRGKVMPLIDARKRLGMTSSLDEVEEFCELMQQREQDHRNWLAELEASVKERRKFALTTDPHQCKFGKWYDAYEAPNHVVKDLLQRFDAPHKAIHAVGTEVNRLATEGKYDVASVKIEQTRDGVLQTMIKLFAELRQLMRDSQREIAVVLKSDRPCAVCVDSVEAVEPLAAGSIEPLPQHVIHSFSTRDAAGLATNVGRRARAGELVLLLNAQKLSASVADIEP